MNPVYSTVVIFICCFAAYVAGSIPFGLLLGKLCGEGDIRKIGSGNIGATNMLRTGRKGLAALTLALDFMKGIVGVSIAQAICNYAYANSGDFVIAPSIVCFAGIAAVLGHIFPVWLKFKGGKGVATTLGVFLVAQPLIGLITIIGWLIMFYLTRISALAAIGSIACAPILGWMYADKYFAAMALVIAVIVIARHKDNIIRLRAGTENKWKKKNGSS